MKNTEIVKDSREDGEIVNCIKRQTDVSVKFGNDSARNKRKKARLMTDEALIVIINGKDNNFFHNLIPFVFDTTKIRLFCE